MHGIQFAYITCCYVRQAFRLPRTTFVWKVCIKFENITKAVYWRFAKANSTRGKISMNILWLLCVMSVRHYAIWTAMFWTNSTNAWRYYVILRNNLRWIFCRFLDCFLATSWHILGSSWWFLQTSSWFVTTFPPPGIVKSTQDTPRSHWDTVKKPMRRKQDY